MNIKALDKLIYRVKCWNSYLQHRKIILEHALLQNVIISYDKIKYVIFEMLTILELIFH